MGITAHLPPGMFRELANSHPHPRLRSLRAQLEALHISPQRAQGLIEAILVHIVEDLADGYLNQMTTRLRHIEHIRGRIAGAIDHVVFEGRLPADLDHAGLSRLFDDLQRDMEQLQSARRHAETSPPRPTIERMAGTIEPTAEAGGGLRPFRALDDPAQGVVGARPPGMLRDAMTAMRTRRPGRAALFERVMRDHGDLLGLAVLAETESGQRAALRDLRDALGTDVSPAQWTELVGAVDELGTAHSRALRGGPAATAVHAQRVADLPQELRSTIGNDRTILGPLAEQHPADLHELWQAWVDRGRQPAQFRDYVYGEMRSGRRPALAEWQAAHDLATQHGLVMLKDPARFDPNSPSRRTVNPREGGTDLLGLRDDGEIWYVDDKSHRVSPSDRAAGATGINLSSVSAFEGRTFIANIRNDVAELEAGFMRMRAEGGTPDPRALEACDRLRRAADALDRQTRGWSDADFADPVRRQQIAALLASPEYRIRLSVTSTMGDVTGVTQRLRDLGIGTLPQFSPNPTRARLP
jgi:hypothetical protein